MTDKQKNLVAARLKLQTLEHEIRDGQTANALFSLSKLRLFLADAVGQKEWEEAAQPVARDS